MEVQIIQARPQIRFVGNPGHCEDCEEEQRLEDTLKKDTEGDRVSLSQASLSLASGTSKIGALENGEEELKSSTQQTGPKTDLELSEEERRLLNELRARDAEVRAHEQAHLAAAGPYANGTPTRSSSKPDPMDGNMRWEEKFPATHHRLPEIPKRQFARPRL